MNLSRRKRAAACLLVINLLEEDEFGERWWKRGRTREWIKRRDERGMSISTLFSEEPRDTREQLLAAILNEPADFRGKQLTEKLS